MASAALSAMLVASRQDDAVRSLVSPLLVLVAGVPSKLSDGTTYLLPQTGVNDEGTQTNSTLVPYRVGLDLTCTVRPAGVDAAAVSVDYNSTSLLSLSNQGVPTTTGFELSGTSAVSAGGTVLIAELERTGRTSSSKVGLSSLLDRESSARVVQLWAEVRRVSGGSGGPGFGTGGASEGPSPKRAEPVPGVGPLDLPSPSPPVPADLSAIGSEVASIRARWSAGVTRDLELLGAAERSVRALKDGGK